MVKCSTTDNIVHDSFFDRLKKYIFFPENYIYPPIKPL